jgi:hypothetical protein
MLGADRKQAHQAGEDDAADRTGGGSSCNGLVHGRHLLPLVSLAGVRRA